MKNLFIVFLFLPLIYSCSSDNEERGVVPMPNDKDETMIMTDEAIFYASLTIKKDFDFEYETKILDLRTVANNSENKAATRAIPMDDGYYLKINQDNKICGVTDVCLNEHLADHLNVRFECDDQNRINVIGVGWVGTGLLRIKLSETSLPYAQEAVACDPAGSLTLEL